MWYHSGPQLKCYCQRMHVLVWDDQLPPISSCDGRELELLRMQSSLSSPDGT
jgi:hypothetical protein